WSSDVCSSDLVINTQPIPAAIRHFAYNMLIFIKHIIDDTLCACPSAFNVPLIPNARMLLLERLYILFRECFVIFKSKLPVLKVKLVPAFQEVFLNVVLCTPR